jgi:hypothetical protein
LNRQARIRRFLTRSNWTLLITAAAVGFRLDHAACALGIVAGGLIVTVNFHLVARTLKNALHPLYLASHRRSIVKYYLPLIASGIIFCVLIAGRGVDPLGLFIGLSVVVASIFVAAALELTNYIFKEAV